MKLIRTVAMASLGLLALTSCDAFKDDPSLCLYPDEAKITFKYQYNMDNVDKFADPVEGVHCIDLYVFDKKTETLVAIEEETNPLVLQTGTFSFTLSLPKGEYFAVAYGGAACEDTSFDKGFTPQIGVTKYSNLSVSLKEDFYYDPTDDEALFEALGDERSQLKLHPLFYGRQEFTVNESTRATVEHLVPMMRNTNTLKVSLKSVNGESLDVEKYHFMLKDVNNDFDHTNHVSESGEIAYRPFEKKNVDGVAEVSFALSRLTTYNTPQLIIRDQVAEQILPAIDVKDEILSLLDQLDLDYEFTNGEQEYLDREHYWNIEIVLDGTLIVSVTVKPWNVVEDPITDF